MMRVDCRVPLHCVNPPYDFVSTIAYIEDDNMALSLAKSKKMSANPLICTLKQCRPPRANNDGASNAYFPPVLQSPYSVTPPARPNPFLASNPPHRRTDAVPSPRGNPHVK